MYFLRGADENLRNLLVLCRPFMSGGPLDTRHVKAAYRRYLRAQQPYAVYGDQEGAAFVKDRARCEELSQFFRDSDSHDDENYDPRLEQGRVEEGFLFLRELDPDLAALFDLVVDEVFVMCPPRKVGSGSSPWRVGLAHVNPAPQWRISDIAECLMHEFAHTLLYLDALRYGHHPNFSVFAAEENQGRTALLDRSRPMFFVFQSIFIAVEILSLRRAHELPSDGIHGPTMDILRNTTERLESCMSHPGLDKLATPRFMELLGDARQRLLEMAEVHPEPVMSESAESKRRAPQIS